MSDEIERLARQVDLFPHERRRRTAIIELCGGNTPCTSRALKWCSAAMGLPAIFSDFHGEGLPGPSLLTAPHFIMVPGISESTRYEFLDRDFLGADIGAAVREFPLSWFVVSINRPTDAAKVLSEVIGFEMPVLLHRVGPAGVWAERAPNPAAALRRIAPLQHLEAVAEGDVGLAMLTAGNIMYEATLADQATLVASRPLCFYSLHRASRVQMPADADVEQLMAELATPLPHRERLAGRRLFLVGGGGLGALFSLAVAFEGRLSAAGPAAGDTFLTCFDKDLVELSNLNRTIVYAEEDVGRPKATCLATRLHSIDLSGNYVGNVVHVEGAADLASLTGVDALVAAPDNDLARVRCAQAARAAEGVAFVTGATSATAGSLVAQLPDGPCFECQTGMNQAQCLDELAQTSPCLAEPAVCPTNMIVAGLMASELREIFSGRRPQNLRFQGKSLGNRLVTRASNVPCPHRPAPCTADRDEKKPLVSVSVP